MSQTVSPRPGRAARALLALTALALAGAFACAARATTPSIAVAAETTQSVDSSATTCAPLPLRMKRIGDTTQLLVATGKKLGSKDGTLSVWEVENGSWVCTMSVACRFGKHGIMDGERRWSGNKTTPTGLWRMPGYLFGYRKSAPAGTKLRYVRITKRSWWSSKRGSTYNGWVEAKKWPGEHLYGVVPQYELAISSGYNAKPNKSVYGRGSGIFLHIWGTGYTAGCVAISRANMLRVSTLLDPTRHPSFAVGTLATGTPTAIWAY